MTEYVYKIDFPFVDKVIISHDKINDLIPKNFVGSQIFYVNPKDILKPQWLSFKNIDWDYMSVFIRSANKESILHRDDPLGDNYLHWGINWVIGDASVMQYWNEDMVNSKKIIYDSGGEKTVMLDSDLPPIKQYFMKTGVYLVNASIPHKVKNLSSDIRIALSLRSKKFRLENPNIKWNDILKIFNDFIEDPFAYESV